MTIQPSLKLHTRWWDPLAASFLLAAMFFSASRLNATQWVPHLSLILSLAILGLGLGFALGQSIFSPRLSMLLAALYGMIAILWRLGVELGKGILWLDRLASLYQRLFYSLVILFRREPVEDPLLFILLMAILYWSLGVHAGYVLVRFGNPWRATLPAGIAALTTQIADPYPTTRAWLLAIYLFFCLLVFGRSNHLRQQRNWRQQQVHLPPYLTLDMTRYIVVAGALLIIVAWSAPTLAAALPPAHSAWQTITRPWRNTRDRLRNAFASLRQSVGIVQDYYGAKLSLGRGNVLNDNPVLMVEVPNRPKSGVRFYWRARVFDHYEDGTWSSTLIDSREVTPKAFQLKPPEFKDRWEAKIIVTAQQGHTTLFTSGQPLWVSHPAKVELAFNPDGSADIAALIATPPLAPGETYQAKVSLTATSVINLRAAGREYPSWVASRYLQLPPEITQRTLELSRQITTGLDNPYDIASTIVSYLRTKITYRDTLPPVPSGQEPLDWMLFDLQQGFCNYYASAMVIMLRSLGIPARLAVGYAQGERVLQENVYLVRQRDAHAWPEVFFPSIGWVEFEPTVSQAPLHRPYGEILSLADEPEPILPEEHFRNEGPGRDRLAELLAAEREPLPEPGEARPSIDFWLVGLPWAVILTSALFLLLVAFATHHPRLMRVMHRWLDRIGFRFHIPVPGALQRWSLRWRLSPIERSYLTVNRALRWMQVTPPATATPAERCEQLKERIPQAAQAIDTLLKLYQQEIYGPHKHPPEEAIQAARVIRSYALLKKAQRLVSRFQEPQKATDVPSLRSL